MAWGRPWASGRYLLARAVNGRRGGPSMENTPVLTGASPVLPAREIPATIEFYRQKLGFRPRVQEEEYAIVRRDGVEIHFWKCADPNIAAHSRCRLRVKNLDALYE